MVRIPPGDGNCEFLYFDRRNEETGGIEFRAGCKCNTWTTKWANECDHIEKRAPKHPFWQLRFHWDIHRQSMFS